MYDSKDFKKFDMAEYLNSEEDIAFCLEETAEDDLSRLSAALETVARACSMSV